MSDIIKQNFSGLTMPTVISSPKCQVVIPKKEREKIGLKPGARVVVEAVDDHIEIRLAPENPIDYFCGFFKEGPSLTKDLLKERKADLHRENRKGS